MEDAVRRECRAARGAVAVIDVSTLGKIDVSGPDALWFLEKLYVNSIASLPVRKARYSVMCRLDGSVFDDGIVMRTGEGRFFVTASTSHAGAVVDWMEEWLQTEWPERRVYVTSLTEQLSTVAIVGPKSRDVMKELAPALDVSKGAFPFLAVRRGTFAGISDAQVVRVSFSGELAYEVSVPWDRGAELWRSVRTGPRPRRSASKARRMRRAHRSRCSAAQSRARRATSRSRRCSEFPSGASCARAWPHAGGAGASQRSSTGPGPKPQHVVGGPGKKPWCRPPLGVVSASRAGGLAGRREVALSPG